MKKCSLEKYQHTAGDSFFLQNTWPQDGFLVLMLVIAVLSNKFIRFWLRIVVCYCFCLSFKFHQNLSYHDCFLFVFATACFLQFCHKSIIIFVWYCYCLLLQFHQSLSYPDWLFLFVFAAACYCFVCYCYCLLLKDARLNPCALRLSSGSALFHLNFWSGTHQLPPAT